MPTILVTGGAGFIGGCFVRQLLAETDARVVNLDKLTYAGNRDALRALAEHPAHEFIQGDIGDRALVARLLQRHRPDAVVNLAAESHVDRSIAGPAEFVHTNVVGAVHLLIETLAYWRRLEAQKSERFRFLQVSTDEVYGSLGSEGKFQEASAYTPNSPYAASKAAADHFARAFHRTYGLPVLTTHSSNNYGPGQFPEKLIPRMTLNALAGKPLPVYGDGRNVRDWLHVEDHCRALRRVLEAGVPGGVYHIGGNDERTNLAVVEMICELVDELRPAPPHAPCKSLITFVQDRPGHDRRYALDTTKIARDLNWRPQENFESGLRQTVQWYLDNAEWAARRE